LQSTSFIMDLTPTNLLRAVIKCGKSGIVKNNPEMSRAGILTDDEHSKIFTSVTKASQSAEEMKQSQTAEEKQKQRLQDATKQNQKERMAMEQKLCSEAQQIREELERTNDKIRKLNGKQKTLESQLKSLFPEREKWANLKCEMANKKATWQEHCLPKLVNLLNRFPNIHAKHNKKRGHGSHSLLTINSASMTLSKKMHVKDFRKSLIAIVDPIIRKLFRPLHEITTAKTTAEKAKAKAISSSDALEEERESNRSQLDEWIETVIGDCQRQFDQLEKKLTSLRNTLNVHCNRFADILEFHQQLTEERCRLMMERVQFDCELQELYQDTHNNNSSTNRSPSRDSEQEARLKAAYAKYRTFDSLHQEVWSDKLFTTIRLPPFTSQAMCNTLVTGRFTTLEMQQMRDEHVAIDYFGQHKPEIMQWIARNRGQYDEQLGEYPDRYLYAYLQYYVSQAQTTSMVFKMSALRYCELPLTIHNLVLFQKAAEVMSSEILSHSSAGRKGLPAPVEAIQVIQTAFFMYNTGRAGVTFELDFDARKEQCDLARCLSAATNGFDIARFCNHAFYCTKNLVAKYVQSVSASRVQSLLACYKMPEKFTYPMSMAKRAPSVHVQGQANARSGGKASKKNQNKANKNKKKGNKKAKNRGRK